jgi:hypothetical protein
MAFVLQPVGILPGELSKGMGASGCGSCCASCASGGLCEGLAGPVLDAVKAHPLIAAGLAYLVYAVVFDPNVRSALGGRVRHDYGRSKTGVQSYIARRKAKRLP